MPLKSEYPVIDDRRYADIVAEARARIPLYTPEWNDFNDNEPVGWMDAVFTDKGVDLVLKAFAGNRNNDGKATSLPWAA